MLEQHFTAADWKMHRAQAQLADKHAVVTGGGRGIGAAIAGALAAAGASVTVMGRDEARLREAASRLVRAQAVVLDVTDDTRVSEAFAEACERFGPVDILVNNAGAAESLPFGRADVNQLRRLLEVNLVGTWLCTQAALEGMSGRPWGRVVNVASTAGLRGYAYVSAYCAAKHGVVGLTRSLAMELAKTRVTVNAVCPGYTRTDLLEGAVATIVAKTGRSRDEALRELARSNPQGRLTEAEEVAHAVLWLCQEASHGVTGQSLVIAGGEVTA
jgi:NAD(P)-dependent dehydrogenase (short-subunit alcohol dehydrogenase family)